MKHAETVTFGGSSLDRAAELRGNAEALADMAADASARAIVFWRGKALINSNRPAGLLQLPMDHPILSESAQDPIFLGREDGAARFAFSIDAWEPDGQDLSQVSQFFDPSQQIYPGMADGDVFAELRQIMTWLTPRDAEFAATARALFMWHGSHQFCANCGHKSVSAKAGWQRDCPECGRNHFPRTDPVVIMLITHGNSVLLGRSPGWP